MDEISMIEWVVYGGMYTVVAGCFGSLIGKSIKRMNSEQLEDGDE